MKNLGIDLGNVVTSKNLPPPRIIENSFEVIKKLTKKFDKIYIISRVNSAQKERAEKWFKEVDFFNQTNIKEENVYFCFERKDKSIFVRGLNINVFIDDRPEVMYYLPKETLKILFNPDMENEYINKLENYKIVKNWKEIEEILL